ncbi:MAG: hypothetical protein P1U41_05245 [Vicingaceae bacterium]|nr:hypothetical protein [Vicingaceae bacterium]
MSDKKNTRLQNIIKDLGASEEKKVLTAIKQLRKHGKPEAIRPIAELLKNTTNETVKSEVISLLYDLKEQNVVEEIISAIEDDYFINEKATLISIFWQSSLDGSEHLSSFIKEAIKGDYLICIEVLTVVENFDATFQETEVEDLKFDIDEAIAQEETEKINLLIGIRKILDELNLEF